VCHSQGEYARNDDGDRQCEVHCNTLEGLWTGLRNVLHPFRGGQKKYLAQSVAMFERAHNLKRVTADFLRLLIVPSYLPTCANLLLSDFLTTFALDENPDDKHSATGKPCHHPWLLLTHITRWFVFLACRRSILQQSSPRSYTYYTERQNAPISPGH
jgi:hypothetical protein